MDVGVLGLRQCGPLQGLTTGCGRDLGKSSGLVGRTPIDGPFAPVT